MSRILLIDDDAQVNEVVRATLEMLGHSVHIAENADLLDEALASFDPEITLVDYMLPGTTGLDVLKRLHDSHPETVSYLATGMADFDLLRKAVDAGATSMLCKPYRITDLAILVESATRLEAAILQEKDSVPIETEALHLTCNDNAVTSLDLAQLIAFARKCGADSAVALRAVPVVADELMKNAATHGAVGSEEAVYCVDLENHGEYLSLTVSDHGPGFDPQRALVKARTGLDKARASGLQLVLAHAIDLTFDDGGRIARARICKHRIAQ